MTADNNSPDTKPENFASAPLLPILDQPSTRRTALKAAGAALGLAAFGEAFSPLMVIPENVSVDEFLQQHYKELTHEDKQKVFARLEAETKEDSGADVTISDPQTIPGVRSGYAINVSKCNGNGKCMEACNKENNHHRGVDQSYIRVLEMSKGSMDMEHGTTTFDHTVPQDDKFYMPVQCQQCDNPPCVSACPIEATWQEDDGIAMTINLVMLASELFTLFYTGGVHVQSAKYLFFGSHGHYGLVPWIWTAIACNLIGTALFFMPKALERSNIRIAACVLCILGIWIEKGMGLIVPGFIPSTLHEIVEYSPSLVEWKVTAGIWAFGFLILTVMLKLIVTVFSVEQTLKANSATTE